jgi:hypothetical protein
MKRIERLKAEVVENLDVLSGSVVMWRSKCGKNCVCNNGMKHVCHYLSSKRDGRTRNLYLPPGAVAEAKKMTARHKKLKALILEIGRLNYEALKEQHLTKGR